MGGQPGLIQREPLDELKTPTIQREPLDEPKLGDITASSDVGDDRANEVIPQIVTPRQLDSLADKLVPRIKRLMRAEMERGVFR